MVHKLKLIGLSVCRIAVLIFGIYCAYLLYTSDRALITTGDYVACGVFSTILGFIFGVIFCCIIQMMLCFIKSGLFSNNDN